ncbi:MAG: DUF721 domain-containing protein, partial [Bacillota bacterium]|nr:DUF721 domain-containing protein [Bacillota bacterium]
MIPIAKILDQTLKKMPNAKKIKGQIIQDSWPDVVGEPIAAKTKAVSFDNGILFVWVRDSVWAQHLSLQKKQIIQRLNRAAKTRILHDIRFQAGGRKPVDPDEPARWEPQENWREKTVSKESLQKIEESFTDTSLPADLAETMKTFFIA